MSLLDVILQAAIGDVGGGFGERIKAGRLLKRDHQVRSALRHFSGSTPGFTDVWVHGYATVEPGGLRFGPTSGPAGQRYIRVTAVDHSTPRRTGAGEPGQVAKGHSVARLATEAGALEWAVRPELIAAAGSMLDEDTTR